MDNHPIPQDVTGFQFRLIGDMTIKQFAYLAAGVVLAWITISIPLFVLIKFSLVLLFGGMGLILAFIPLGGRPADAMIFYFFKAVFSPTQYVYKTPTNTQPTTTVGNNQPVEKKEEKKEEKVQLSTPITTSSFDELFGQKAVPIAHQALPATPVPPTPVSTPQEPALQEEKPKEADSQKQLSAEEEAVAKALQEAKKEEVSAKNAQEETQAHEKVTDLETELQTIMQQKQQLEQRLLELQKQLQQKPQQVFNPSTAQAPQVTENVRKIPVSLGKTVGTPFVTDVPNLICGIVKDPRGNVLPNILIEVKDKDGNPVRAFKTNPLGQFASATPVINGTYTITFEDPHSKQRFDTVELTATGEIMDPLEVISIDAREDLRKELFGS